MTVPFGVIAGSRVAVPSGTRLVETLAVGDLVYSYNAASAELVERAITAIDRAVVQQLVAVETEGDVELRGCTPGMGVYDGFEDLFRGAGSLYTLSELVTWDGESLGRVTVLDMPERTVPDTEVFQLALEGGEGTWFADGVLLRHRGEG